MSTAPLPLTPSQRAARVVEDLYSIAEPKLTQYEQIVLHSLLTKAIEGAVAAAQKDIDALRAELDKANECAWE